MDSAAADVFLSYNRTDADAVRRVQGHLQAAGLATFLDHDHLAAGQPWLPALEQAIARCGAVAVFVGPVGLGTWQQREVQLALDRQVEAERTGRRFPVIPVLLPTVEDPPGGFLQLQTWVDLRADLADPVQLQRLLTGIRGVAPAVASPLREVFCPYRGLLPFREEDAGLFFGRQEAIDALLHKLRAYGLVTLVGRSGSGKSSVVSAGLIPALRRRADGRTWSIFSLRPGPEPLHALVRLFDPPPPDLPPFAADHRVEQQVTILRTTEGALSRRLRSLLATADERGTDRLLLHVDQWEELYTQALHQSPGTPAQVAADVVRFIDLLLEATRTSPCTVVLTVRADFYGELLQHDRLAAAVPPGQVNLGPMRREDLTAAIQQPATAVGLTVDPPLLAALLDAVGHDLGKLPLLAYALKETWRGREGTRLTLNAYGQAGGIDGAIAKRANDIYTHLRPAEQAAARRLFVSLVTPGEGREDTRARAVYPSQDDAIRAVVDAFSAAEARLLVTGEDSPSIQRLVEISHEALIREWDVLKAWINDNREALRRREHIRARMRQWEEQDRNQTLLLPPGLPLEEGRKLLADHGDVLLEEVQPYITASIVADEARLQQEEAEAEAERQRELAAAQRVVAEQRKRTRLALGFSLVTLLLAMAAGWQWRQANAQRKESDRQRQFALEQRKESDTQRQFALARQLAAQAERVSNQRASLLPVSVLLASEALQRLSSLETDQALRNGLTLLPHSLHDLRHESWVRAVNFSPDGRLLVSGSGDKTVRVWESATGKEVARMTHEGAVWAVSFSPDGRLVVSGSRDKTARVWESATGKEVARMTHEDAVTAVSFSPDGRLVVSGSEDKTARVWESATGKEVARMTHEGVVWAVSFDPDGRLLVSGSWDKTARVWESATGKEVARMTHEDAVTAVSFSPDGRLVVSGSGDKTVRVWESATGKEVTRMTHEDTVTAVSFSPDGRLLVSGSGDKTVRVWESATGKEVTRMTHEGAVRAVNFSPDGRLLVSGSGDKTARVWESATGKEVARMTHEDAVWAVNFSPDGRLVVSGSEDKTARVWESATGKEVARMTHEGVVRAVSFSPDGRLVVSGSEDKTARVWESATGKEVARMTHEGAVWAVNFSPDGRLLVSGSEDKTARVWESATGKEVARMTHEGAVWAVSFSPDGRLLVSGSGDKTVRVWESATGQEVTRMTHEDTVTAVSFSPDGRLVVSGSRDKTARVWESATGKEVARMTHEGVVRAVSFSPDGRLLVSGSRETARVWESATGKGVARMRHEDTVWAVSFSPDGRLVVSGSGDKTARVWESATGKEVAGMRHEGAVWAVSFSPDGRLVVSGSGDNTAQVWESATGKEVAGMRHEGAVWAVSFSPDGRLLVSGSGDNTVRMHRWRPEDLIAEACARLTRNLTKREWGLYLGGEPYQQTCKRLPEEK